MPPISKKFKIFPIPKNLSIKNSSMAKEIRRPRLVLAKIVEKVKRRARKDKTKNKGSIPKKFGSKK